MLTETVLIGQALLDENPTGLHFNPHAAAGAAWHEEVAADPARQHAVRQGEAGEAPREAVHEAAAAAREAIRGAGSTAARHGADVHTLPQVQYSPELPGFTHMA